MLQKKVCMLGSFAVGKTSLVRRFVDSIYADTYLTTVGVKVDKKIFRVAGQDVSMVLWDLYGEDDFQKLRMSYLRGASGFLLVCDGTRRATLDKALAIHSSAEETFGKTPAVIALNKCDLAEEWEIPAETETGMAARGWTLIRTSAKTGVGVEEVFERLARIMAGA